MLNPDARDGRAGAVGAAQSVITFFVVAIVQETCDGEISQMNVAARSIQVDSARGSVVKGRRPDQCGIPIACPLKSCIGWEVQGGGDDISSGGDPNGVQAGRGV